jgi:hypothetical protein
MVLVRRLRLRPLVALHRLSWLLHGVVAAFRRLSLRRLVTLRWLAPIFVVVVIFHRPCTFRR